MLARGHGEARRHGHTANTLRLVRKVHVLFRNSYLVSLTVRQLEPTA
jgi:hypothetical protein